MRVIERRPELRPPSKPRKVPFGTGGVAPVTGPLPIRRKFVLAPEDEPEFFGRQGKFEIATIAGGLKQYISVIGIPSKTRWPTPTITGGVQTPKLWLGGIDRTLPWFSPMGAGTNASACVISSQAIGRMTCTFDLVDTTQGLIPGTYASAQAMVGLTVRITENGATLFVGCIDTIDAEIEPGTLNSGTPLVVYHCTALDKASICDRRIIPNKTYAITDPFGNPLVQTISSVILDIVANYLNGEGITTGGVPQDGSLGNLSANEPFNYQTVTTAFDRLASLSGTIWWIGIDGVLNFSSFTNLPAAPFSLTLSSANYRKLHVINSLSGGSTTTGYRNKQYVVSNLNVLPGGLGSGTTQAPVTETFTFTSGQPGIVDQPPGTAAFVKTSLPIGSVVSMTVNGNAQTVVEFTQWSGQGSSGPTDNGPWFFLFGGQQLGPTNLPVPAGATIVVKYIPGTNTNSASVVVGSALVPSAAPLGGCGSGIFEAVQQVKDISLQADLNAIASAILTRSGSIPKILSFETDQPGLFVGQKLSALIPAVGLGSGVTPDTFLITRINGVSSTGALGFNSFWQWTVEATSNPDPGNWVTWYSRLIARTENALPVLQYEDATFVLAPGASLSAGNVSTNPYIVSRTGLLVDIVAAAGLPPVNQDLKLSVFDGAKLLGSVVIPAGSSALQTTAIAVAAQVYVFRNDVLSVTASYQNITGTASPAGNITLKARWSM